MRAGWHGRLVRVPEWRPAMAIDANVPAQMWVGVALKPAQPYGSGSGPHRTVHRG